MHGKVKIVVYHAGQCDTKKCTALKLKRHRLVKLVTKMKFLPKRAIILNPLSKVAFSPADRERIENFGLVALDCSWEHSKKILMKNLKGNSRCLPFLFAGNPTNFSKATKLSTVEALAAALYIAGFKKSKNLLAMFKWGNTFYMLNQEMLDEYSTTNNSKEIIKKQASFIESLTKQ